MILLWFIFLLFVININANGILYPRNSETREVKYLDGIWDFKISPINDTNIGFREKWYNKPLKESGGDILKMPVPASYNDITTKSEIRDLIGWVWYDRTFYVPSAWISNTGTEIFIRFGSVHYHAIVWINGVEVIQHEGGHLPFQVEITNYLKPTENRITVAVNNTLTEQTIPQGKIVTPFNTDNYPPGYVMNSYTFDFFNYAGIHRSVNLYTVPDTHIDDITITTKIDKQKNGYVNFIVESIQGKNKHNKAKYCIINILDDTDTLVTSSDQLDIENCTGVIKIENANLWWPYLMHPKPGYLYTLEVKLIENKDSNEPIDVYRLKFGIRTITWNNASIFINGERFYFRGLGRHEDLNVRSI